MRRRRRQGPPVELPAELRYFDPVDWPSEQAWRVARLRRMAELGIDPLVQLRGERRERRRAMGWRS